MSEPSTQSGDFGNKDNALVYDPLSPTPYKPDQSTLAPPPVTAPPPITDQKPVQSPSSLLPHGKGSTLATIATLANGILKGAMQGRDMAEQRKAYKQGRLMQGLQYNADSTARRVVEMAKNGVDPNSKEFQDAAAAADAADQALQQMYANYWGEGQGKKSKGSKAKDKGDPTNPIATISDPNADPRDKVQAWLQIRQKMGPTWKIQAAPYMTPEYQKQRELAKGEQQITGDIQAKQIELHKLQNIDPSQLDDKQKQRLEQLRTDPELFPKMASADKKISDYIGRDEKKHIMWQRPDGSQYETIAEGEVRQYASQLAKPGSEQEFIERVAKEQGIDPKQISSQSLLDLRHAWLQSAQMGKTVGQNYVYTDKDTGEIHVVPLTRSTTVEHPKVPKVSGEDGSQPTPTGKAAGAEQSGDATRSTNKPAASSSLSTDTKPNVPGDRVIGHTTSTPHQKSMQTVTDTYKKQKPLIDLLSAQEDYMKEIEKDPSKASPRQDLALIVAAVRSMNPGSVRLPSKELELELKAGSYGDRFRRWWETASKGLLPDDQRKDLFTIVQRETTKAGESIAKDWKQYMNNQPLPEDLKRFVKESTGSGSGGAVPDDKLHPEVKKFLDTLGPAQTPNP